MAGVSVSHMILFIASMLIAASVAGVFTDSIGQLRETVEQQGGQVTREVRTDVEIISDSGSTTIYNSGDNDNITLHVENTGSATLAADATTLVVYVNGRAETDVSVSLEGDATTWRPGEVARVEISKPGLDGLTRVRIVVNGDEEVVEFQV